VTRILEQREFYLCVSSDPSIMPGNHFAGNSSASTASSTAPSVARNATKSEKRLETVQPNPSRGSQYSVYLCSLPSPTTQSTDGVSQSYTSMYAAGAAIYVHSEFFALAVLGRYSSYIGPLDHQRLEPKPWPMFVGDAVEVHRWRRQQTVLFCCVCVQHLWRRRVLNRRVAAA
jgi:hypothetical protein